MCKGIGRLVNDGRFIQYCILIKHYGRKSNEKKQENATWQKKTKGRKSQTKTFVEKHRRKTQKNICKEGKYSKHIDGPFTYWFM